MHKKKGISFSIEQIIFCLKKNDSLGLRILSNKLIKEAVLYNDKMLATASLIAYSFHKFMTKEHIISSKNWKKEKEMLLECLYNLKNSMLKNKSVYEKSLSKMLSCLKVVDERSSRYMQSIWDKAKIKYAADAYYSGLSLSNSANLTGADLKTLQEYIGATKQFEKKEIGKEIQERLELALKRWKL